MSNSMLKLLEKGMPTKKVDFMGASNAVTIRKLSQKEISDFQAFAQEVIGEDNSVKEGRNALEVQNYLLRLAVAETEALTDEQLSDFPSDDLNRLFQDVLFFSGVDTKAKN